MDEAEKYRTAVRRHTEDQALPEERGLISQALLHQTSSRKPGKNLLRSHRSQYLITFKRRERTELVILGKV